MNNTNQVTNTPGQQERDPNRAPAMPQQSESDRKDAETKEGKPQDGKPQQK